MTVSRSTGAVALKILLIVAGILFILHLSSPVNAQVPARVTNPVPEPRIGHGLVYHEGLQRVLVFGGRGANGVERADLWAWDGETWTLLNDGTSEGPSPRSRFAMAYDRSRDRLVLHGGGTRQEEYADTWEWDGERWIQVDETGPGPRSHHGMAYDAVHKRIILFGGGRDDEGLFFDDTWSWDGEHWSQLEVNGPPGRVLYDVASDLAEGAIYLFGGFGDNRTRYNDLWRWDGTRWDSLAVRGPTPRISSALTYLSDRQSLLLSGGETPDGETGDSWLFESGQWQRLNDDGPRRNQHDMAYDPARGRVVLFGGKVAGEYRSDVWEWDGSCWMVAPRALPREPVEILVLGTFHFADGGLDSYEPEHEVDIFSATRQKELDVVLDCLESFGPTKIGLERKWSENHELNEQYGSFLAGDLELSSNEIHQIGFRLAKRLNHQRVFAIDAHRRFYEPYIDPGEYAEEHGQALNEALWEEYYTGLYRHDDVLKMEQSLIEHLLYRNSEDRIERGHGHYLVGTFRAGAGDEYPGVDAKIAWYNRNLRIFANVQRITESPDDRILVVIGAGHLPILRHAFEASPEYHLVDLKDVLTSDCR